MKPPSIKVDKEPSEDTLGKQPPPGTSDEAKTAAQDFLRIAISKAKKHVHSRSTGRQTSLDDLFKDLGSHSGLCAWHCRKLKRILRCVESDSCNLEMIRALEKPLCDFFDRDFNDDAKISMKEYKFYDEIKLEGGDENGGMDEDLIFVVQHSLVRWYGPRPAKVSKESTSPTLEALDAVEVSLRSGASRIRSYTNTWNVVAKPARSLRRNRDINGNRARRSLGANLEEFKNLIQEMQRLITTVRKTLSRFGDVTSSQHLRALIVLQDDIHLEFGPTSTWTQSNSSDFHAAGAQNPTPYQRAQDLEKRVREWVTYELECCEFRDRIRSQVKASLKQSSGGQKGSHRHR